jgi:hypothetical protein
MTDNTADESADKTMKNWLAGEEEIYSIPPGTFDTIVTSCADVGITTPRQYSYNSIEIALERCLLKAGVSSVRSSKVACQIKQDAEAWRPSRSPVDVLQPENLREMLDQVLCPTGDFWTIRPVDLLRKSFEELALALRWVIASKLEEEKIYFSVTRGKNGTVFGSDKVDYTTLKKSLVTLTREPISNFLSSPHSFDVFHILSHILCCSHHYGVHWSSVSKLIKLRNFLHHRSFLLWKTDDGGFNAPLFQACDVFFHYIKVFEVCIDKIPITQDNLRNCAKEHWGQVEGMHKWLHCLRRIHQHAINSGAYANSTAPKSNYPTVSHEEYLGEALVNMENPKLLMQLSIVLGARYSTYKIDKVVEREANIQGVEDDVFLGDDDDRFITIQSQSLHGPQVAIKVVRHGDGMSQASDTESFIISDPLTATNADILHRGLDALAIILNKYVLSLPLNVRREKFKDARTTTNITMGELLIPILTPMKVDDKPAFDEDLLDNLYDPNYILGRLDNEYAADIARLRTRLAHQVFVHSPKELNILEVGKQTKSMLTLAKTLAETFTGDPALNRAMWVLEALQSDKLALTFVPLKRQQNGYTRLSKDERKSDHVKTVMSAILSDKTELGILQQQSLWGRWTVRKPKSTCAEVPENFTSLNRFYIPPKDSEEENVSEIVETADFPPFIPEG